MERNLPDWLAVQIDQDVRDDEEFSDDYLMASVYEDDGPVSPYTHPKEWAIAAITDNPGAWTAWLCRVKHDLPETNQAIAHCGLCKEYANPRKRQRDANLGPELPGFEGKGAYRLHPPCSKKALSWLRHTLKRMVKFDILTEERLSIIPDLRQSRGWDYATRYFRKESN